MSWEETAGNASLSSVKTSIQQTDPCFCCNMTISTLHKNVHLLCPGLIKASPKTQLKSFITVAQPHAGLELFVGEPGLWLFSSLVFHLLCSTKLIFVSSGTLTAIFPSAQIRTGECILHHRLHGIKV